MRPIQLWLPAFCSSPFVPEVQRIRQRAYSAWRGDDVVWVVPGIGAERTDRRGPVLDRAIEGEHLECLTVYHIGDEGDPWGPGMAKRFPIRPVTGLLSQWLNVKERPIYAAPSSTSAEVPDPKLPGIQFTTQEIRLGMLGRLSCEVSDPEAGRIEARWPPPGKPLPIVSVDQESRELTGGGVIPIASADEAKALDGEGRTVAAGIISGWPSPLDQIVPAGTSLDAAHQQGLMRGIATLSLTEPQEALRQARNHAANYVDDGTSNLERAWFLPMLGRLGKKGALFNVETRFSIAAESVEELLDSPDWSARGHTPIPITRAWGGVGLMWAFLLAELEAHRRLGPCENCGQIISRHKGRRFCGRQENRSCVNDRERARKIKSRFRHNS